MNVGFSVTQLTAQAGLATNEVATDPSSIMVSGLTTDLTPPVVIDGTSATLTEAQVSALRLAAKSGYAVDTFELSSLGGERSQLLVILGERTPHTRKEVIAGINVTSLFPRILYEMPPFPTEPDYHSPTHLDCMSGRIFGSIRHAAELAVPNIETIVRNYVPFAVKYYSPNMLENGIKLHMTCYDYFRDVTMNRDTLKAFMNKRSNLSPAGATVESISYRFPILPFDRSGPDVATTLGLILFASGEPVLSALGVGALYFATPYFDKIKKEIEDHYRSFEGFTAKHIVASANDTRPTLGIITDRGVPFAKVLKQRELTLNLEGYNLKPVKLPKVG